MISREVILESAEDDEQADVEEVSEAEELTGKMQSDPEEERLAHSVLENDEQKVQDGQLLAQSVDYALNSFTPDMMFEKLVSEYRDAQRLYGPTLIRALSGFDPSYIEKNLKITEFKEQLKQNLQKNIDRLKNEGLLDDDGSVTEEGLQLAALVMYTEELDALETEGLGKKEIKEHSHYGEKIGRTDYRKQRYKDIDIRASVRRAVRRGHSQVDKKDLKAVERAQHGKINIVYALDASGSMRGKKIHISKKAGIALAFKAIQDQNAVGLVVFTSKIQESIAPTQDFAHLLHELTKARAGQETDLELAIDHAVQLFERGSHTKHLVLITDALPTRGEKPELCALEAVGRARDAGVTVSIVGINLEKEGEKLAKKMVEISEGKLYGVKNLDDLDMVILEDYESLKE